MRRPIRRQVPLSVVHHARPRRSPGAQVRRNGQDRTQNWSGRCGTPTGRRAAAACSAAAATWWSRDDGFDGTALRIATRGVTGWTPATTGAADRWRPARTGTSSSPVRRRGAGRGGVPVRHPRPGRGHADPERRRLRPGGRPDHHRGPRARPGAPARSPDWPRRVRVRLPDQPVQAATPRGAGTSAAVVTFAADVAWRSRCPPRCATPSWPRALGVARAAGVRWPSARAAVLGCAAARAWCSTRPTTTPGAPARSSPTRCWTPAEFAGLAAGAAEPGPGARAVPAGDGAGQDPGGLADRAGRLRPRATRHGAGVRISTKHTLALTNRGGATHGRPVALAAEIAPGVRATFGVELVNEPVLVGVRSSPCAGLRRRGCGGVPAAAARPAQPASRRCRPAAAP